MTADILNLRHARKQKKRAEAEKVSAERRAHFGQSKAEKGRIGATKILDQKRLDGAKRRSADERETD